MFWTRASPFLAGGKGAFIGYGYLKEACAYSTIWSFAGRLLNVGA